ncbi:MAG: hypothetical protein AAGI88_18165 [Pseudomonadota bacterium]
MLIKPNRTFVTTCFAAFLMLLTLAPSASAASSREDFILYQMSRGDAAELRAAARGTIAGHVKSTTVLDPLAETMLQNAAKGGEWADAVAWGARALGESRNSRYANVLSELSSKKTDKKIRKYAKKALKQVGKNASGDQYQSGTVNLASLKRSADQGYQRLVKNLKPVDGKETIAIATAGMSQSQVMARCGPPSSTSAYITGKSFIPFNFKGGDSVRTMLLYQGQGYLVVSNSSAYTSNANVIEVVIDPDEPGYR